MGSGCACDIRVICVLEDEGVPWPFEEAELPKFKLGGCASWAEVSETASDGVEIGGTGVILRRFLPLEDMDKDGDFHLSLSESFLRLILMG